MIKSTSINSLVKYIYFLLVMFIYFLFIFIDLSNKHTGNYYSILLKYISILIFFLTSLLIGKKGHSLTDTHLLQSALLFTLCADTCLLILNYFKLGIFFFCIVQILYIIRHTFLYHINIRKDKLFIYLILIVILSFILNIILPETVDSQLYKVAIVYAILLTTSLLFALRYKGLIAYGLILFFLCDINVALSYLIHSYSIYIFHIPLRFITSFLVWIFYFPSQLLLTLSGFKNFNLL